MSLRSVDFQVALPRVQEAGRAQPINNQEQNVRQEQFALQFQKQVEQSQQQVTDPLKSRDLRVEERTGGTGEKHYKRQPKEKREEKEEREEKLAADPLLGRHIDIEI